ncbi:hypothetical protein RJ640_004219 [Escallonia rubra]|uniref:SAM domain-containing protein n=1 Tax=Escallonia rubra TaxID=112253 RepID=A0AA88QMX1_9ASTE|nr:hypothetical protein RJ640_004219 [Escallonia rubra]
MNSKRQRRPNVRLGEIGDMSAAFARGISQEIKENLGQDRWKFIFACPQDAVNDHIPALRSSESMLSDPGVSPRILPDTQQNRENKNPNSMGLVNEVAILNANVVRKSKLDFGTLTRKCRLMKRRKRSARGKRTVFAGLWYSEAGPEFSSGGVEECEGKEDDVRFAFSPHYDNHYSDYTGHESLAMSKEISEKDFHEAGYYAQTGGNTNEFAKEFACDEGDNVYSESSDGDEPNHQIELGCSSIHSVGTWLEELGFGKYAALFEIHEVDEEALWLLTFEDLKDMGVLAVGPRRKLYTAIQQLKEGRKEVSA